MFIITVIQLQYFAVFEMTKFRLAKQTPEVYSQIYSVYRVSDQKGHIYYAKIFSISKLQQYGLAQTLQYNEEVLSDLQEMAFPEQINKIIISVPNDGMFTFITEPYETNLEEYMRTTRITEVQALQIFDNVLKAVYSVYVSGYWHKCIRPEHFVKVGNTWKLESIVYTQDTFSCKGFESPYTWDPSYQPPQVYEKDISTFTDQQFLPVVVWNLGSLLLDLFFSVHKLKNHDILRNYKGKKFRLEDIKVKKTDLFSKKLKEILSQMLHYDAKSRMKLQEVFLNQYLSKQVAHTFKKKHKNSLAGAIRIFTGGKSALSSALFSKQQRQKGSKILPLNQTIKSTLQNPEAQMVKTHGSRETKSLNDLDTNQDLLEKVSLFTRMMKRNTFDSSSTQNNSKQTFSIESMLKNSEISPAVKIYVSCYDKSSLLSLTGHKFQEINYKGTKKQIILLSKYAVEVSSYLNLQKLFCDMHKHLNSLGLQNSLFTKFEVSSQFQTLKTIISKHLEQKQTIICQIGQKIDELGKNQRNIVEEDEIQKFLSLDFKRQDFSAIKVSYRKILKISYDLVTKQYNNDTNNDKLARLAMYIVYSLTIDKLYIPHMIEKNFQPYFQWSKQKASSYIPMSYFQRYIEQAPVKTLILHAKAILERYFKL